VLSTDRAVSAAAADEGQGSPDHAARVRCPVAAGLHHRAGSATRWRERVRRPLAPVRGGVQTALGQHDVGTSH